MARTGLRGLAGLCLFVVTAILLAYVPTIYYDQHYLGALFVFASIALLGCAILVMVANHNSSIERFGWTFGAVVMTVILGGYVASRTIGLVSYQDPHWIWPGSVTLAAVAVFDLCFLVRMRRRDDRAPAPAYPDSGASFSTRRRAARQRAGLS
jgi:MFS family permease